MGMSPTFNSLGYAKELEAAGIPRNQAEAQANALRKVIDAQLATKQDLHELEYRVILKLGGIVIGCSAILLGLLPLLLRQ